MSLKNTVCPEKNDARMRLVTANDTIQKETKREMHIFKYSVILVKGTKFIAVFKI